MSQQSILSGIIAGEGNGPADQYGVASVIYNRSIGMGNFSPTSAYAAATAPSQFSAYPNALGQTTPYTDQLAANLIAGNPPGNGSTGNALYYNAPGYNAAYASGVGNNYGPGTNQYSDLYNQPPSSNFSLPGGSAASVTDGQNPTYASGFNDGSMGDPYSLMNPVPGQPDYSTAYPMYDPNAGAYFTQSGGSTSGSGSSAPGYDTSNPSDTPGAVGTTPGYSTGQPAPTPSQAMSGDVGQGAQVTQGLQQGTINAITSWISTIMGGAGNAVTASIKAAENGVAQALGGVGNWFLRGGLILLAIIIIGVVLFRLMDPKGEKTAMIVRAAAA